MEAKHPSVEPMRAREVADAHERHELLIAEHDAQLIAAARPVGSMLKASRKPTVPSGVTGIARVDFARSIHGVMRPG